MKRSIKNYLGPAVKNFHFISLKTVSQIHNFGRTLRNCFLSDCELMVGKIDLMKVDMTPKPVTIET